MKKPTVSPDVAKAVAEAMAREKAAGTPGGGKRLEASPRSGASEIQSIRPARTAIAHARGGNKGK